MKRKKYIEHRERERERERKRKVVCMSPKEPLRIYKSNHTQKKNNSNLQSLSLGGRLLHFVLSLSLSNSLFFSLSLSL